MIESRLMEPKHEGAVASINIMQLVEDQWRMYQGLRLEMLLTDPQAFHPQAFADFEAQEDKWRRNITDGIILVAYDEFGPAGMIRGVIDEDRAVARNMYSRLTHRGQGVGRKLMEELLRKFEETQATVAELEVESTQIPAQAMYQSFGFFETGRVEEGDHFMITMQKPL